MSSKQELHRIIESLPDPEVQAALRFLQYLRDARHDDPLVKMLMTADEDPEPLTPEEAAAVDRALTEYHTGQTVSWEEVRRRITD